MGVHLATVVSVASIHNLYAFIFPLIYIVAEKLLPQQLLTQPSQILSKCFTVKCIISP